MPRIIMANRHETFDRDILHEMGALGMLGTTVHVRVRMPGVVSFCEVG